jgi:hypothetical protein
MSNTGSKSGQEQDDDAQAALETGIRDQLHSRH